MQAPRPARGAAGGRQAWLSLRIDFPAGRLGPGKVELLEHIGRERSISAAARAMEMSYKRAWELVDTMNRMFREPVVVTLPGRNTAGATEVTVFGQRIVALYRAAERQAGSAATAALAELSAASRPTRRLPLPARGRSR
jgi:molybdate transport system regulatory protein